MHWKKDKGNQPFLCSLLHSHYTDSIEYPPTYQKACINYETSVSLFSLLLVISTSLALIKQEHFLPLPFSISLTNSFLYFLSLYVEISAIHVNKTNITRTRCCCLLQFFIFYFFPHSKQSQAKQCKNCKGLKICSRRFRQIEWRLVAVFIPF